MDGRPATFERFVTDRGPSLLRFAYLLTGDAGIAEDVVQEALAKVHRHWPRVMAADRPEAYVRRMVVNEATTWRRRRRNRERPGTVPDQVCPDGADAAAERDLVWRVLATLPARQRVVLVLRYYQDLADAEIASMLGCSEGTVRSTAARAFAALRRHPQLDLQARGDLPAGRRPRPDRPTPPDPRPQEA